MASVSTYLNFDGTTEEVFEFYRSVFGTEYIGSIFRYGDMPVSEGEPKIPDHVAPLVLNVQLPILGGHVLMGTDSVPEFGGPVTVGSNVSIVLHPDSREEADRLFGALAGGGTVSMPMADQFWGDYYGALTDRYGIQWMISVRGQQ